MILSLGYKDSLDSDIERGYKDSPDSDLPNSVSGCTRLQSSEPSFFSALALALVCSSFNRL